MQTLPSKKGGNEVVKNGLRIVMVALWLVFFAGTVFAGKANSTIKKDEVVAPSMVVKNNGQLQVLNGQLCNEKGEPIQLKGFSTHGLHFCAFTKNTLKYLVRDWHISVIRPAMYVVNGGYIQKPELNKERVKLIVDQAIQYGIYVIIDWHVNEDMDPNKYRTEAKAFFEEMATTYGKYPNVIYEICNEPNHVTWKGEIKPYAETIIPAIRAIDPDSIIIVGTDSWSTGVDNAADDPLTYKNLLYTLHFYAGSHQQSYRDKADYALSKGIGIFVTEFGTTNYTGAGMLYLEETQKWMDWMKAHKISWCNWNFSNFPDDTAAIYNDVGMNGPWADKDISESGLWIRSKIMEE